MEVKPGYKQTEVGVIPEEWELRNLSRLSQKITDGDHVTPKRTKQGYYLLSARNILNGLIDVSDVDFVGRDEYQRMKQRCGPEVGDVLISCSGTIGRVAVVPANFECVLVRSAALAKIDRKQADGVFIQYWLQSYRAQSQIFTSVNQGAQPNLFLNHIERLRCPQPPLAEQRAIATALSDMDALLDGLDRLIAKKRDLKQAAMQQLLTGQTRLPGFHCEWEVKRLKTIVQTPVTDGPHLTPRFLNDGIPFLSVNNLAENRIDLAELRFISRAEHEVFSRKCKPRKDDILLGKAASVGKVALVELDIEFNIWSPIAMIRINCDNAPRFVYYQLQSADLIGQITLLTNSSSQGNIGMGDIEKLKLNLPPLPEQTAIAEVLSDMDGELAALEQRREKTRALKQAMMQELLTGRTRLV